MAAWVWSLVRHRRFAARSSAGRFASQDVLRGNGGGERNEPCGRTRLRTRVQARSMASASYARQSLEQMPDTVAALARAVGQLKKNAAGGRLCKQMMQAVGEL